ncbi:MAG TPA: polyribonucleotide nucleotidyltransferase [Candidatus Uhrbacteria bacterium]|nr:polyribonucleotide nucleotidyltransferase [Candidatus Uhrbacteria bacterium]
MSEVIRAEKEIAGRKLVIETGKLANQANGSVTVSYGDTVVLATAVISNETREGLDFFPLTVEFEERFYAAGKIKGSRFIKREGRPTDEAILSGRMIDRAIRPLFDEQIRNEVQVILTILSYDGKNESSMVGLIAASAALAVSNIPWDGPIAGVEVGSNNGSFILNPTVEELASGQLHLSLAGTAEKIIMIEAQANEIPEDKMTEAITFGQQAFQDVVDLINEVVKKAGKEKLNILDLLPQETEESLKAKEDVLKVVAEFITEKVNPYLLSEKKPTKALRKHGLHELVNELVRKLTEQGVEEKLIAYAVQKADKLVMQKVSAAIMEREIRVDGRKLNEIRPLSFETGIFKRTHGTGLFQRGETQVLSTVTLGSPGDVQLLDTMEKSGEKRFIHYYTFAPFSVGEVKRVGIGRRDIGHGALAEKALLPVIPTKEDFPYTIVVVSETLGSNGSSSMASTCGTTLALLDAGVPLKEPVAGIAMGLAVDGKGGYKILTDIQDLEDGPGGMDFKITGTKNGITAIQMDTKTDGLTKEMVEKIFSQGREALNQILAGINKTIPQPKELSPYAPRISSFYIDPDKIKEVIGPGGKVINKIIDETGVSIDIEDNGLVMITATDSEMSKKAKEWIEQIVKEVAVGEIYEGKVIRIMDFGAIVEFLPGKDGMIHISKMAPFRIAKVTDVLNEGDEVKVKIEEVDKVKNKISLILVEGGKTPKPAPSSFRGRQPQSKTFFKRDRF